MARANAGAAGQGRHVYISGLTGAGAAMLARRILAGGDFASLTGRDMPFVLAPNIGGRIDWKPAGTDPDSPEAYEEAFWRVFDGDSYLLPMGLKPHAPDREVAAKYRAYVAAILHAKIAGRYLAKNNSNILRLRSLVRLFPNAEFLIPFRAPQDHAAALLAEHVRTSTIGGAPQDYVGWLSHHEFGPDHRPYLTHPPMGGDPATEAYWLAQWKGVYGWLLRNAPEKAVFVSFEDMCNRPTCWQALARRLDVPSAVGEAFGSVTASAGSDAEANEIHGMLLARARAGEVSQAA